MNEDGGDGHQDQSGLMQQQQQSNSMSVNDPTRQIRSAMERVENEYEQEDENNRIVRDRHFTSTQLQDLNSPNDAGIASERQQVSANKKAVQCFAAHIM